MMRRRSLGAGLAITAIALFAAFVTAPGAKAAANVNGWASVPSDSPADTANVLNGVSCPTATNCWAAGTQRDSNSASGKNQVLVEKWNPSTGTWTKVSMDNEKDSDASNPDSTTNALNAISCNSSTNCWAGGWFSTDSESSNNWHDDGVGLGLHFAGTDGHPEVHQIPTVAAKNTSYKVNGISCVNDNFCVAVGVKAGGDEEQGGAPASTSGEDDQAFIALWQGATWEDVSPEEPDVNAEQRAELNGVSCTDANHCMAVGRNEDHQTLAIETSGLDSQGNSVGGGESDTWFSLTTPTKGESGELNGVSCITANNCWAAGTYADDHKDQSDSDKVDQALIEHWTGDGTHNGTGGEWDLASGLNGLSSNQPSEVANELNGIHCESATLCFAVGTFAFGQTDNEQENDGVAQVLIDQFNGTSWSLAVGGSGPPANRTTDVLDLELQNNVLNGVDCLDANNCAAVGEFDGGVAPPSNIVGPVSAQPDDQLPDDGTHTLVDMWSNPTPGSTPGTTGGTTGGTGNGTGSPSTSVQAAKVPVPATGGGGALPLILLAGAGVASLAGGVTLIRSRKR